MLFLFCFVGKDGRILQLRGKSRMISLKLHSKSCNYDSGQRWARAITVHHSYLLSGKPPSITDGGFLNLCLRVEA